MTPKKYQYPFGSTQRRFRKEAAPQVNPFRSTMAQRLGFSEAGGRAELFNGPNDRTKSGKNSGQKPSEKVTSTSVSGGLGLIPCRILLLDATNDEARSLRLVLSEPGTYRFEIVHVDTLCAALDALSTQHFDCVFVDLDLPDSSGLQTLHALQRTQVEAPIFVLANDLTNPIALAAMRQGAQDVWLKGVYDPFQLSHRIRFALERYSLWRQMQDLALRDELTQLNNRRGFLTLAEHYLTTANRKSESFVVVFLDLDYLKTVNDHFGHHEGDRAIRALGDVLRETFRRSDIMGRLGGDEFVVVLPEATQESVGPLLDRFEAEMRRRQIADFPEYDFSASFGFVAFQGAGDLTLDEVLVAADTELYRRKTLRNAAPPKELGS